MVAARCVGFQHWGRLRSWAGTVVRGFAVRRTVLFGGAEGIVYFCSAVNAVTAFILVVSKESSSWNYQLPDAPPPAEKPPAEKPPPSLRKPLPSPAEDFRDRFLATINRMTTARMTHANRANALRIPPIINNPLICCAKKNEATRVFVFLSVTLHLGRRQADKALVCMV